MIVDRFTGEPACVRQAFNETFERITGKTLTLRGKASLIGISHSSLHLIISGLCPHSGRFVHALQHLGFTPADFATIQKRASNLTAAAKRAEAKRAA